ncbi:helix-turn-helix transcriptional regulator [Actinomadura rupiterrae]|uniref:helix-turn-helix transcriptional regulator n=1 Tax=Actinomadura rupiterrae TaxID=559627 RepID=UPI0020A587D9|nr:helix-turn-helix transcriptional regulator [Actinomadura rupiterrae]MCP2342480.1 transcriptional regulator with XRE-family HTH domain [Actinomadura rupiterrae]
MTEQRTESHAEARPEAPREKRAEAARETRTEVLRAKEFGDLLRSRRERLQPSDVGLPAGTRRRTRGLRREEVAQLAAISATYYAYLEQGRETRPSRQVIDALAEALRLDPAERAHAHELIHGAPATPPPVIGESLSNEVVALVNRLDPCPTYVTGRRWDVLASNRAARALWTDWTALPPEERNMVWWMFTAPSAREVLVEWEREAAALLGRFRASAARFPGDPGFGELLDRLRAVSPEVRAWWPQHEITPLRSGVKLLRHPELGEIALHHVVLQLADDPEQRVVTFAPSASDQARIAELLDGR